MKRLCRSIRRERGVSPEDVAIVVETPPGQVAQVDFGYEEAAWGSTRDGKRVGEHPGRKARSENMVQHGANAAAPDNESVFAADELFDLPSARLPSDALRALSEKLRGYAAAVDPEQQVFPAGTYWMVKHHGARVEPFP